MLDPFVCSIMILGLTLLIGVAVGSDVEHWVIWSLMVLTMPSIDVYGGHAC